MSGVNIGLDKCSGLNCRTGEMSGVNIGQDYLLCRQVNLNGNVALVPEPV